MTDLPRYALWLDTETDGLLMEQGLCLEVAAVLTLVGVGFPEIARRHFYIENGIPIGVIKDQAPGPVVAMHEASGLWGDLEAARRSSEAKTMPEVDWALEVMLNRNGLAHNEAFALAGSGVSHFEWKWIARPEFLPQTMKRALYWQFDISPVRRFIQAAGCPTTNDPKAHRAMDDVEFALSEARSFTETFDNARRKYEAVKRAGSN